MLYNNTGIPDNLLQPIVDKAAEFVGVPAEDIPVFFNWGPSARSAYGSATPIKWARIIKNRGKWCIAKDRYRDKSAETVTPYGYTNVTIPQPRSFRAPFTKELVIMPYGYDAVRCAEWLYYLLVHEFQHNKDFHQYSDHEWDDKPRRNKWSERPEEIRAIEAEKSAKASKKYNVEVIADAVLDLAVALEEVAHDNLK